MEKTTTHTHLNGDELELYSMGRLSEAETARAEEHLLVCELCQHALTEADEYVQMMKQALPVAAVQASEAAPSWWRQLLAQPRPLWAAGAALAALLITVPIYRDANLAPAVVQLKAVRSERRVTAPSDRPLVLQLSREGVERNRDGFAVLLSETGDERWTGPAVRQNGHWTADLGRRVDTGSYWVRVYSGPDRGELLREFQLHVQ